MVSTSQELLRGITKRGQKMLYVLRFMNLTVLLLITKWAENYVPWYWGFVVFILGFIVIDYLITQKFEKNST